MEDNKKNTSKDKSSKKNKNQQSFFSLHKAEFKKITWPTKKELVRQTFIVLSLSIIVGAIIFGYDMGLGFVYDKFIQLIS